MMIRPFEGVLLGVQRISVHTGSPADKHPRICPLTACFDSISHVNRLKTWILFRFLFGDENGCLVIWTEDWIIFYHAHRAVKRYKYGAACGHICCFGLLKFALVCFWCWYQPHSTLFTPLFDLTLLHQSDMLLEHERLHPRSPLPSSNLHPHTHPL